MKNFIVTAVKALWAKVVDLYQSEPAVLFGGIGTAAATVATEFGYTLTRTESTAIIAIAGFIFSLLIRRKVSPVSAPAAPADATPAEDAQPAGA